MSSVLDSNAKVNFSSSNILLVEQSAHSLDVLTQILVGFGARNLLRATSNEEAIAIVKREALDLVVIDPYLKDCDGHEFITWLRRDGGDENRSVPVVVVSANASKSGINRVRNAGANFFVLKPITPNALLDRVMWVVKDPRPFYEGDTYCGPDRRFKFEGPPVGAEPRRASDAMGDLGDATEPNMSQTEIDSLLTPQKVAL